MPSLEEATAARLFLKQYTEENGVSDICLLFDKETLIENVYDMDWDWSIKDEIEETGCSIDEARRRTEEWFMSMSHNELFYYRMSEVSRGFLITAKAEELGFEVDIERWGMYE